MVGTETRPPKGFRHGTVAIERWELVAGERVVQMAEVPALVCEAAPHLAMHKPVVEGYGLWTVTHTPSGKKIASLPTQALARQAIGSLASLPGWLDTPMPPSLASEVEAILSSLLSQHRAKTSASPAFSTSKRPTRKTSPSSFSPVWRGFVPTTETRAAGHLAAAALGEAFAGRLDPQEAYRRIERAAQTQWREEIMVRVTQPPHASLLPSDVPDFPRPRGTPSPSPTGRPLSGAVTSPGPPSSSTNPGGMPSTPISTPPLPRVSLRDGTPATPAEFKRRYNLLLELGDRLRAGSQRFQTLHAEGQREGWTVARLERWEATDARFRAIVGEAWLIWSGAALCLAINPPLLANVERKLGYVGNTQNGWHDLGMKTFLRWPEIQEVLPLRREMRERIWREL